MSLVLRSRVCKVLLLDRTLQWRSLRVFRDRPTSLSLVPLQPTISSIPLLLSLVLRSLKVCLPSLLWHRYAVEQYHDSILISMQSSPRRLSLHLCQSEHTVGLQHMLIRGFSLCWTLMSWAKHDRDLQRGEVALYTINVVGLLCAMMWIDWRYSAALSRSECHGPE